MTDADELRMLQRKAYRRDGGLTAAEAARLDELETARMSAPASRETQASGLAEELSAAREAGVPEHVEGPSGGAGSASARPETQDQGSATQESGSAFEGDGSAPQESAAWPAVLRRHWRPAAAASAALLLIGLGAGWALFAPREGDAVALTADEAAHRLELDEKLRFDEGSLRPIARDDDALVWFATKDDGAQHCVVLDVGAHSQTGCAPVGSEGSVGPNATVDLPPADDAPEGDSGSSVNALLLRATTGEPVAIVQRWENSDQMMLDRFEGDDRTRAEELLTAEDYLSGIALVGEVLDAPVWAGDRFGEQGELLRCLIVDGFETTACDDSAAVAENGLSVVGENELGQPIVVTLKFIGAWNTPYLTVTEHGESTTVHVDAGEQVQVPTDVEE
ncbi:hypothetical protein [Microbacterium sp.]|uniref:hypothetical protein n=1 Tax=Microbacterium sp. TaxID=51671 RepID=UPI0039E22403